MRNDDLITIGDKVELVKAGGRTYKTMIEDFTGNGFFLAGVPSSGGMPMTLRPGEELTLNFSRESGKYSAGVSVVGFEKRGEVRYAWLMQRSRPRIHQRREAFRLPAEIKVLICGYEDEVEHKLRLNEDIDAAEILETVSSKDISVTGAALVVRRKYELAEKLLLKTYLSERQLKQPPPFIICAKVVRLVPELYRGRNCVGIQFFGQTKGMHEYLSKYMLNQQQKQIRQRKRFEG